MCKFSISQAVGFCMYMFLEHRLGKSETGSVIGIVKKLFTVIVNRKGN